jgi:hypothetical protein
MTFSSQAMPFILGGRNITETEIISPKEYINDTLNN